MTLEQTEQTDGSAPQWVSAFDYWTDPGHHEDPYPHYAELRRACPVAHSHQHGGYWMVSSYEDVHRVMRDTEHFSNRQLSVPLVDDPLGPMIPVMLDPPEHTPWRAMLNRPFSPARVAELEPIARSVAVRLLERIRDKGDCEFVSDFAIPMPVEVFIPLLGMPESSVPLVMEWEDEGFRRRGADPEARDRAAETMKKAHAHFGDLIEERKRTGPTGDDVISILATSRVDGREIEMHEAVRMCVMLMGAGLHTTSSAVANMMVYLCQHPEKRDELVHTPALIPNAVEELLRYESIVTTARLTIKDTELGGQQISAGEPLLVFTGSAGRDERQFEDADEVIFDRQPNRHLAFGAGVHRCVGSHLARMELIVALQEIHRVIPDYRPMPGRVPHRHTAITRGTDDLWLLV